MYTDYESNVDSRLLDRVRFLLLRLQEETTLDKEQIVRLLDEDAVNVSVFQERSLGILEALVRHLKEEKGYPFRRIAKLLNRDSRTIWSAYEKAKGKAQGTLKPGGVAIPVSIFRERRLGVLESLVVYLREQHGLRYAEIASMLGRDQRTIWTAYRRASRK